MMESYGRAATVETAVEPGWGVYDSGGGRLGLVDEVHDAEGTFTIRRAGFALGVLEGEVVVPRRLVADTRSDGIILKISAAELGAHSI
jgi:hypothetical protein